MTCTGLIPCHDETYYLIKISWFSFVKDSFWHILLTELYPVYAAIPAYLRQMKHPTQIKCNKKEAK